MSLFLLLLLQLSITMKWFLPVLLLRLLVIVMKLHCCNFVVATIARTVKINKFQNYKLLLLFLLLLLLPLIVQRIQY